ncbi:MAG: energy transducer TonB [Phaeodactylibacter sp.]|nr:energy transducer TonB [Phaeodactylibacter sp.]
MAYDTSVTRDEEQNKKRGMMTSVAIHVFLIMLALLPLLTFPDPPPGQAGILVNLGLPDEGQGTENAPPAESVAEDIPDQPEEEVTPPPADPKPSKPEPEPKKQVITTEDPSQVAIRKEKERKERERQEQLEQQRREQERLERERREQEAREKAEREAKEREAQQLKDAIGGAFGGGDGSGKGNTGKPGNQGDPGGDPDADRVTGISTGSGVVEGFGGRGVLRQDKPQDNSQDQGKVVVRACIDSNGNVISAEFTQAGSTATSSRLKQLAVSSAKKWKFAPGSVDKQCGTITFNFRLN